jgi:hypothetical protein
MLPVSARASRKAAQVVAWWPTAPRRYRRSAARWWWSSCDRTSGTWPEQWRVINAAAGVVETA